ncbi:death-associated protein kinase, partial [Blomia tropicalis]
GKFAIVKRCIPTNIDQHHHHGCAEVAAKFIRKSRSARFGQKVEDIELEIAILTELRHNNIIQLIDVFEDVTQVILVFELMKGGELQDYITDYDRLTESEARVFLRQILSAVVHLHERSIVHLDLKPENILLTEPGSQHLKIIDFGISRRFDAKADIKGVYGTPEFIAPEILNYESIGYGTDIWAIGCIAYTMLYGQSPFLGDSKNETFTNITRATFEFDDQICDISSLGRDFIKQCLVKDIRKRMTACDAFNHEWITTIDTIPIDHVISLDSLVDSCHQTMSMFGVKSGVGGGNRSDGSDSLINGAGSLIDTSPSPTSTTTIDSSTSTIPSRS